MLNFDLRWPPYWISYPNKQNIVWDRLMTRQILRYQKGIQVHRMKDKTIV